MKAPLLSRISSGALWGAVLLTAAGAGWFSYRQEEAWRTDSLLDSATLSAADF